MTRCTRRDKLQPERRFLGNANVVKPGTAGFIDANPAALIENQADVLEQLEMLVQYVAGAKSAAGFLVSGAEKYQIAAQRNILPLQRQHRRQLHDRRTFVIQRPSSPNHPVFDYTAEGRLFPQARFGGNYIHVIEQYQSFFRAVAFEPREYTAPAGLRFDDPRLDIFIVENCLEKLRGFDFVAWRIGGVDLNVPAQHCDRFIFRRTPINLFLGGKAVRQTAERNQ